MTSPGALKIYELVNPLDTWRANSGVVTDGLPLWVDVLDPTVINTEWFVDGLLVAGADDESFSLRKFGYGNGTYSVKARAYDDTPWVRRGLSNREQQVEWTVTLVPEPATMPLLAIAASLLVGAHITLRKQGNTRP